MTNKVIVYKSDLLPYSETFIKEQVLACKRWHPVLMGSHRVGGLSLEGVDWRVLRKSPVSQFEGKLLKLWREAGLPLPRVLNSMRAEGARLVHVHFGTEAVALWPTLKRLGLPVLVTLHGADINIYREWWQRPQAGPASRLYPDRLVALGGNPLVHFIAVSDAVRDRAIEYGLPPEKITVRYIGVDLERFRFGGEPMIRRAPRILYVGRMVEKKGGQYLLDAFAALRARVPQAQLAMIGDGPLLPSFRARADELGVPVEFMGVQPADVVRSEMERARIFCLPSITAENGDAEGLGIVVVEAQACGVPVVTSARGGATEGIIDGVSGFAFAERDVSALTERLVRLLQDAELAQSMSDAALELARKRFDILSCTSALEGEYDRLASLARRGVRMERSLA